MLKITPGRYRTRAGGVVEITGPHPRWDTMFVGMDWSSDRNPGACWWDTGVHPHNSENDLVKRLQGEEADGIAGA